MTKDELYKLVSECNPAMCWEEVTQLLLGIQRLDISRVLEIGVHMGGSLRLWRRLFDPSLLIGIDSSCVSATLEGECKAQILDNCRSQDIETLDKVAHLLGLQPLDLLVIDGGHTLAEVCCDFVMYGQWVQADTGIIVIHDIHAPLTDECDVALFWKAVKPRYWAQEFYLPDAHGSTGLGLVWV